MNKPAKKLRLRLLIYPKFQLSLVFANLCVISVILVSVYLTVHQSFSSLSKNGAKAGLAPDHPYFKLIDYQSQLITKNILITLLVSCLISSLWMLILSNKLAGPILRLKGYFSRIANGEEYERVSFRKGDFFIELPPLINDALKEIEDKRKT